MSTPEQSLSDARDFWHPLPVGDTKPLPPLRRIPLHNEYQWPPPPEKWQKIPPRHRLGIEIPDDPELIRWALAQAAKTVKRRCITPLRPCGLTREEREYDAHNNAVNAVRAERAFIAELVAHARAFFSAFCELRQGGKL